MSSEIRLSILGLYNYGESLHDDLFENLTLPEGINRADLINNILEQGASFETLYPDYEYLKFSIGAWSRRWYRTIEKWINVLSIDYDPLYNYNRYDEWEDSGSRSGTTTGTTGSTRNLTGSTTDHVEGQTDTTDSVTTTGEDELSVVAYNSDTYHNKEKRETSGTSSSTGHSETETDATGSNTEQETISGTSSGTDSETTSGDHSGHMYGNIGVMSTQDMLQQELDIQRFNLIQQVTDLFLTELCILVY